MSAMGAYWGYILTNKPRATLYVGVTNDLVRRTYEHREGAVKGFTQRYGLKMLVHFEKYDTPTPRSSAKRISSTGHDFGNFSSSNPETRSGETFIATSRAEGTHGLPCQARQ